MKVRENLTAVSILVILAITGLMILRLPQAHGVAEWIKSAIYWPALSSFKKEVLTPVFFGMIIGMTEIDREIRYSMK